MTGKRNVKRLDREAAMEITDRNDANGRGLGLGNQPETMLSHGDALMGIRAAATSRLNVHVRPAGGVALVTASGDCSAEAVDQLSLALDEALERGTDGVIVVLGADVEIVDSSAVGAVALAWRHARRRHRPLCVVADDHAVRRTFERADIDRVVAIVENLGEAFATLRRERRDGRRPAVAEELRALNTTRRRHV
jgi:anti-anti-sigma factor